MRKLNPLDFTKFANSSSFDDFDDLYDEALEQMVVKEVKEIRKGKGTHSGFKKEYEWPQEKEETYS